MNGTIPLMVILVGVVVASWLVSVMINIIAIWLIELHDGQFGLENRIWEMILSRDYLGDRSFNRFRSLVEWGGFLAWTSLLGVFITDQLVKLMPRKEG